MPMGLRWFVKRRRMLLQLTAATVFFYVLLDAALTLILSQKPPASVTGEKPVTIDMVAAVSPMPRSDGNVNMMLSLNIKGIMRYLDEHTDILDAKRLTADPAPLDVDIVQHDQKRCEKIEHVTWLICVHSKSSAGNKRELLRSSWASDSMFERHDTRVVFFIGQATGNAVQKWIKKEFSWYSDLVQGNFTDDAYSGPIKSRLMLKWVTTYCKKAKYILKVNDDSLVDIIRLMALVEKKRTLLRLIACPLIPDQRRRIERDPRKCSNKKFCANYTGFPGMTHFPRHCDGVGYVLSQQLVAHMYKVVNVTPGFWLEDVYTTAVLTARINQIQYIDFYESYTTDSNKAVKDTTVLGKRKFIISRPKASDYSTIWKWMMGVLEPSELKLLSREFMEKRPELARKLNSTSRTTLAAVAHQLNVTKKPGR